MDISEKLFDYLWQKPHREYSDIVAGGRREWVFEIPKCEEKKFFDLYCCALVNGPDGTETCELPMKAVRGPVELTDGSYSTQFAGYDFDGFYQSGSRCDVKCVKYVKFYRVLWYIDNWPAGRKRVCWTEPGGDKAGYVACIIDK